MGKMSSGQLTLSIVTFWPSIGEARGDTIYRDCRAWKIFGVRKADTNATHVYLDCTVLIGLEEAPGCTRLVFKRENQFSPALHCRRRGGLC